MISLQMFGCNKDINPRDRTTRGQDVKGLNHSPRSGGVSQREINCSRLHVIPQSVSVTPWMKLAFEKQLRSTFSVA
jgi:hypothetical protein